MLSSIVEPMSKYKPYENRIEQKAELDILTGTNKVDDHEEDSATGGEKEILTKELSRVSEALTL